MRRRILPSAAVGPDLRLCHGPHLLQPFYRGPLPVSELTDHLGKLDPARYGILLAHHPCLPQLLCIIWSRSDAFRPLSRRRGGPWRAPGACDAGFPPFFRKNCRGLFLTGGTCQIISAGTGEHTIPVRIWNRRELIITDIGKP